MSEAQEKVEVADEPFNEITADAILRTADGVDFHVHQVILSLASPFFKTMFTLTQPPRLTDTSASGIAKRDSIPVTEDSVVLDSLLRFIYPVCDPCHPRVDIAGPGSGGGTKV